MIGSGNRRHLVTLANPTTPQPDGDGSFTDTPAALSPSQVYAAIEPVDLRTLQRRSQEQIGPGTTLSVATHMVTMPYHAQVTTQTQITFGGRLLRVIGVTNPEERNRETVCACVEVFA